jgi:hypothetical protein
MVDGTKSAPAQALACPDEKIGGGRVSLDPELADACSIGKNAHADTPFLRRD